ncbi:MAG: septum formation protein Maf [Chloroflexi bacterium]|nr:septum formation protein Maf [Chloroflexota bacterium]
MPSAHAPGTPPELILASASPRRQQLLRLLHIPFRVQVAEIDETPHIAESPTETVQRLAHHKAQMIAQQNRESLVLAADTLVVFRNEVIGKPAGPAEATAILHRLRGQRHTVLTTFALLHVATELDLVETSETHVWMRPYTNQEIADYVASGDPLDKAAAYAIQHPTFRPVERTKGCPVSVMGLPLCLVARAFRQSGVGGLAQVANSCDPASNHCAVTKLLGL